MQKSIQPAAFLSYVHDDDANLNGRITYFAERLSRVTHLLTGAPFPIWQDRGQINWGEAWRERIESGLESVTFFLPVITPAYFNSKYCRQEFEKFAAFETARGRKDLILPLYLIEVDDLADPDFRKKDTIARILLERQYADWREFLFEPAERLDKQFQALAQQIKKAMGRAQAPATPAPRPESKPEPTREAAQTTREGPTPKTEPKTFIVDQMHRGDFTSIGEAVSKAPPGARILVRPGLYQEGIVMNKPLEIIGDGPVDSIVMEASSSDVILFKTTMGRVANLTLRQRGGGNWYGVDIAQGRLDLEDCDIQSDSLSCVAIHGGASPRVLRNKIHDGEASGILVYENGRGTIEDNEIYGNTLADIEIKDHSEPLIRKNRLLGGVEGGILVRESGKGVIEQNEIYGGGTAGIEIKLSANPIIRNNRIHGRNSGGIYIHDNGLGIIEQNEIYNNSNAGIRIKTGGNPTVRNNQIYENEYEGVWINENGRGTFENNTLRANKRGAWDIAEDCLPNVKRSGNIEQ